MTRACAWAAGWVLGTIGCGATPAADAIAPVAAGSTTTGADDETDVGSTGEAEEDTVGASTGGLGTSDGSDPDGSTGAAPEGCPDDRPVPIDGGCYPQIRPYGFHLIHQDFEDSWDAIADLAQTQPDVLITSQNRPPWLSPLRWGRRTSPEYFDSGEAMADAVAVAFADADEAPAVVIVDELRTEHIDEIAAFARHMREQYPQWSQRWGVWLVHGLGVSYESLQPAIDELLRADAILVPELYPAVSQYCAAGSTTSARDAWLTAYYRGGQGAFPQPRFTWLVSRRAELSSDSPLSLAFGVTETYLDQPGAHVFLDRMFYVWRHHSGFGSLLFAQTGGVGAYKWHDHGPTTRDDDFVASYLHYSVDEMPSSRLGPVSCP